MSSLVLYFLLFITRPCYHEPRNAAVARPTEAELKLMLRSAFFVLTLAAFASTAGVADDKNPSGKPDAAQTTRPQDKGLDKMMPFTGPAVDPKSYIIGPEDVLYVRVWREPDLSGPVSVGPDGKISMQLIN